MKKLRVIGRMNNKDGTLESSNRVYDRHYICPTITTCGGGGIEPKVIKRISTIKDVRVVGGLGNIWGQQFHQQNRVYDTKMCCASLNAAAMNGLYIKKYGSRNKTGSKRGND